MKTHLKVSNFVDGVVAEVDTAAVFEHQPISDGRRRIVASVPGGGADVLFALLNEVEAPFYMLYVLHTSRGEAEAGRYQSPAVSAEEARCFIGQYKEYFAGDSRFDFWIHSPASDATIVWDRHNRIFAYGPLNRYADALKNLAYSERPLPESVEHVHYYRPEFDGDAQRLLCSFEWTHSPLRPEDEQ